MLDFPFKKKILKLHKAMARMEQSKYLNPHFSFAFEKLAANFWGKTEEGDQIM